MKDQQIHLFTSEDGEAVTQVISEYARSWSLLQGYDEQALEEVSARQLNMRSLDLDEALAAIGERKQTLKNNHFVEMSLLRHLCSVDSIAARIIKALLDIMARPSRIESNKTRQGYGIRRKTGATLKQAGYLFLGTGKTGARVR